MNSYYLKALPLLLVLIVAQATAQTGTLTLQKRIDYEQIPSSAPRPVRFSYQAQLALFPALPAVPRPPDTVQLNGPNGVILILRRFSEAEYFVQREVGSESVLNTECPDGTYVLAVSSFTQPVSASFTLAVGTSPTRITNLEALQGWRGYGARVEWESIPGAAPEDRIGVTVTDSVFGSAIGFSSLGRSEGNATSAYLTTGIPMGYLLDASFFYERRRTGWLYTIKFPLRLLGNVVVTAAGQAEFPAAPRDPIINDRVGAGWLACDPAGNVYWTEFYCVRKLATDGTISTLAGSPTVAGDAIGPGSAARFGQLAGIAVDAGGFVYVVDSDNQSVKRISPTGDVARLFAGLRFPSAIALDRAGNIYVSDSGNRILRKFTAAGSSSTLVDIVTASGYADGPLATARFMDLSGLAADESGNVYVADSGNRAIRKIGADGTVSTLARAPVGFDVFSRVDGIGSIANDARLAGLARDPAGNLYTFERTALRRLEPSGQLFTVAGGGGDQSLDGMGANASFSGSGRIAIDPRGNILVADDSRIRKVILDPVAVTPPVVTRHPEPQMILEGRSVLFSVEASGANLTYQWRFKGVPIPGATQAALLLRNVGNADGDFQPAYAVDVINPGGRAVSRVVRLSVSRDQNAARLSNLSVRTTAGTRDDALIVGFVIGGSAAGSTKPVLLRGIGPALVPLGVADAVNDPVLTLFRGTTVVGGNDNWDGDSAVANTARAVGAFALNSASRDAALYAEALSSGGYSMQISGNDGAGVALAELYDATAQGAWQAGTPRLINVSARARVGTGGNIVIVGFVTGGGGATTVLMRAIGPGLAPFSVQDVLRDPKLALYRGSTLLAANDNWSGNAEVLAAGEAVGAFRLADPNSGDAALLTTLAPGAYTVQVSGANGGTGVALVELYELP